MKLARRSTSVTLPKELPIERERVIVRGYDPTGKFVCRIEISNAGVEVFTGGKGQKRLKNVTWEGLVSLLEDQ